MVAMQATWSQPLADVVVVANAFASRRERPSGPWAPSTRQACLPNTVPTYIDVGSHKPNGTHPLGSFVGDPDIAGITDPGRTSEC